MSSAISGGVLTAELTDALIEKIVVRQDKSFEVFYRFMADEEVC